MNIKTIDPNMKENINTDQECQWINLKNEYLRGMLYNNFFEKGYDRLRKDIFINDNIEYLRKCPSGVNISFITNSSFIKIKAKVSGIAYMAHMTAVGTIGFDLYYKNKNNYIFISTTKVNRDEYEVVLVKELDSKDKEFRLYFPLYINLEDAYIGIETKCHFEFFKPIQNKIIAYGTSITQGGCATRPGMSYTSIMDRHLNFEIINLGFSGNCKLEEEIAELINSTSKKYLILEVEANSPSPEVMHEKLSNFLKLIYDTKVILITHFPEGMTVLNEKIRKLQKRFFDIQKKMKNIIVINGKNLLKELNYEGTVDGVHLTDLGFYIVAKKLIKIIKKLEME